MTSFADTVRFCFPASGRDTPPDVPLNTRNGSSLKQQRRDPLDWDEEDLTRGSVKWTIASVARSYAPDWGLALIMWGTLVLLNRSGGNKREFSLNDTTIQHSFAEHERVPPK